MTSAIMILTLAWTLSGVVGKEYLNIGGYVGNVVSDNASVAIMLPALFFWWLSVLLLLPVPLGGLRHPDSDRAGCRE